MNEKEESPFSLPPATRTTLIFLGIVITGAVLAVTWVSREARRVKAIRDMKRALSSGELGGMVWIPTGKFTMGSQDGNSDEMPIRDVKVRGFWMDKTEVTNAAWKAFADATGYQTIAERKPRKEDFPGVPEDKLVAGAICFRPPPQVENLRDYMQWWAYIPGANWRHPDGPGSTIEDKMNHPVVHIAWDDAQAYCKWAKKRLPTEAEWEFAARGGVERQRFGWGNELTPAGKHMMNSWQGLFPNENLKQDGYTGTAPVASFPANPYDLHDMAGNVWEWCHDWYLPDYYARRATDNPQGPDTSFDPDEPGVSKRVTRGGSYLCSEIYCKGYRPAARMKTAPDTGLQHTGFRCVKDAPGPEALAK